MLKPASSNHKINNSMSVFGLKRSNTKIEEDDDITAIKSARMNAKQV